MKRAEVELSDVYARYQQEIAALRAAARVVAHDIFWEHLRAPLASASLSEVRAKAQDFGKGLLNFLLDHGDIWEKDDRVFFGEAIEQREDPKQAIERYRDNQPHRASTAYFLNVCHQVAGGVLQGQDGFRLARALDPGGLMRQWERLMLEAPILEPCRYFAARALASRMNAPSVVFEGGAGVGVVLRTLLQDERSQRCVENISRYHFTELDPAILSVGKAAMLREAPESLQRALVYKRLDLDAFARDPEAAGFTKASVDCVVLEHVLYDLSDLQASLLAFHWLLKPGGALIFTGAFRGRPKSFFPCEMLQLTLASYRRAKLDPPYRTNLGYLSLEEWERSLSRAGFAISVLPAPEDQEAMPHGGVIAYPR